MEKQRCNIHKGIHLYMTYIYIEIEREREKERDGERVERPGGVILYLSV